MTYEPKPAMQGMLVSAGPNYPVTLLQRERLVPGVGAVWSGVPGSGPRCYVLAVIDVSGETRYSLLPKPNEYLAFYKQPLIPPQGEYHFELSYMKIDDLLKLLFEKPKREDEDPWSWDDDIQLP